MGRSKKPGKLERGLHDAFDIYVKKLPELLKRHKGKFIVIGEDKNLSGFWMTHQEAYKEGFKKYGKKLFYVFQVSDDIFDISKGYFYGLAA